MSNRYRLSGTVEEKYVNSVIAAYGAAGMLSQVDPEITASLMVEFTPAKAIPVAQAAAVAAAPAPKKKAAKRTVRHNNGGEWPAKGSIYDIVRETLKSEPKTPSALRDVLKANGFSPGSVNSALNRLQKANMAAPTGTGTWAAAG